MQFKRRNGRKEIILPPQAPGQRKPANDAFLLALARAFRWKDLIESGEYRTVKALAEAVGLEKSYVGKQLNLTLLSPAIVEAVLQGDEPDGLSIGRIRQRIPVRWGEGGAGF